MPVQLEIVSPARLVLSRAVDMVVMPGYEGDLAAMENHAPMIVLLRGGVIALHEGGTVTDRLFVGGGFAEITPERCTILADDATPSPSCRPMPRAVAWPMRKRPGRPSTRPTSTRGTPCWTACNPLGPPCNTPRRPEPHPAGA